MREKNEDGRWHMGFNYGRGRRSKLYFGEGLTRPWKEEQEREK